MSLRTCLFGLLSVTISGACLKTAEPGGPTTDSSTAATSSSGEISPPDEPTTSSTTGEPLTTSSTTGTTTTGTETTATGPVCGDGELDPGEDCDLGAANSNSGACTLGCNPATCGDGLLWIGQEECDFGPGNLGNYGGCNPDCSLAARCGDGKVDAGVEECDLGLLNGSGMGLEDKAPCSLGCRWSARLVFVTSATYDGALGGLPGADLKCRSLAAMAGIDNAQTFRAWLSDGFDSPLTRFEQIDLADAPYVLLTGRLVAESFAELVEQGPRTGIAITEKGQSVFEAFVWTNTSPFGESFSAVNHCADWTSMSAQFSSRLGLNAIPIEVGPAWETWQGERHWTSVLGGKCEDLARLYCFEDGYLED